MKRAAAETGGSHTDPAVWNRLTLEVLRRSFRFRTFFTYDPGSEKAAFGSVSRTPVPLRGDTLEAAGIEEVRKRPVEPAYARLDLKQNPAGADEAILDGRTYQLRGTAFFFLQMPREAKGQPLTTSKFSEKSIRPDRVYRTLPPQLQAIVDKPGRDQRSYRMR